MQRPEDPSPKDSFINFENFCKGINTDGTDRRHAPRLREGHHSHLGNFEMSKVQTMQLHAGGNAGSKAYLRPTRFSLPQTYKVKSVEQFKIRR